VLGTAALGKLIKPMADLITMILDIKTIVVDYLRYMLVTLTVLNDTISMK